MRPEGGDAAHLWDMLDAAHAVVTFVEARTFEDHLSNRMLRGAVDRHIETIGEAANRLSEEFRSQHAEVPWRSIIAQRHVLGHEYGDIKHSLIWKVATVHIHELIRHLEALLPPTPPVDNQTP